jgi:hypothetical protein
MGAGRFFAVGSLVSTLLLSACEQSPAPPKPLTDAQKALALKAVDRAREIFNGGRCYFGGPLAVIEPSKEWSQECEDAHASLGNWASYKLAPCDRPNDTHACLSGSAEFAKGSARVQVLVVLNGDSAWVSSLSLAGDGGDWAFPPARRLPFQDPPMRPPDRRRAG